MREHPLDMSLESFVCPRVTLVHSARCLRALPACTPSAARPGYSHTRAPENFKCKPDVMCTTHRPCLPARPQPPDLLPHPHPHLQPNPLAPLCPHPPHPRFVFLCFVVVSCDVMRREPRSIVALCVVRGQADTKKGASLLLLAPALLRMLLPNCVLLPIHASI